MSPKLNVFVDLFFLCLAICCATQREATAATAILAIGCCAAWLFATMAVRFYARSDRSKIDDLALLSLLVLGELSVIAFASMALGDEVPEIHLGQFLLMFAALITTTRLTIARYRFIRQFPEEDVLIVGAGPLAAVTAEDICAQGRYNVIGFLSWEGEAISDRLPAAVLGSAASLEKTLKRVPVNEVYMAGSIVRRGQEMQDAVRVCERFGMPFALPTQPFVFERSHPTRDNSSPDGYTHYLGMEPKPAQLMIKRIFDVLASGLALWMLSPLLIGVAIAIKLSSRGPVLFRQERVGLHGRRFHMLKFRSMVVNAEELRAKLEALNEQSGPVFKMKKDPRITAVGRFIRKFSIDELPQLVNVLRGDMSIVGPRPPLPSEVEKYKPWQRRRLSVRPGLTCIWQVSGRNTIGFEEWMVLDMRYVDHWSLASDINLILQTLPVVLLGKGAS